MKKIEGKGGKKIEGINMEWKKYKRKKERRKESGGKGGKDQYSNMMDTLYFEACIDLKISL